MTPKQKQFADEYLLDLNATRAYKAVYINIKNDDIAGSAGARLLRNVKVQRYIASQLEKISSEKVATAQEIMEYLTAVLRGESKSDTVVVEGCGEGCSEARCLTKTPDEKEKLKAAELLGKRYGIYTEKTDVSINIPVVITGEDELE